MTRGYSTFDFGVSSSSFNSSDNDNHYRCIITETENDLDQNPNDLSNRYDKKTGNKNWI